MSLKDPNLVSPDKKKRVAIVIANPAISTTTQWPARITFNQAFGEASRSATVT